MNQEKTTLVAMKAECLKGAMRFFQLQMPPEEILALATQKMKGQTAEGVP